MSAVVATILLNSLLFLLAPIFIEPSSPTTEISERIDHIQVIRIKPKEAPAHKKKAKPPKPPERRPKELKKVSAPRPKVAPKLTLPFQLNTRLPNFATDFQLPLAENINFGHSIDGSFGMDELDTPLTPVARIPPVYPLRAKRRSIEGWVRVAFEVDEQGLVNQLQIVEAKPVGYFEQSVMRCVSRWRFKPGTVEGVPVRARMETTVRFELE